jgi:O-antigen/teichoic acid export membrane protein
LKDKNYLLSVLGLSAIPRIVTSTLTFICFPLMIRALGATNYGIVVYIGAIIGTLESFVDFGVSSAAGKAIAEERETNSKPLNQVIECWAKLQTKVALIGFIPLISATYLISVNSKTEFSLQLMGLLVLASWITISLNFVRASLNSLLAFKSLAIVDTFESILRSATWLCVAFFMPSPLGLAIAQIISAFCTSALSIYLLKSLISGIDSSNNFKSTYNNTKLSEKLMLKESSNFLWLRLITRLFQAIPIFLFGRIFGTALVGIIGAFAKISELINFPFSIIGNALAVRAQGVVINGVLATRKLWDTVSRIIALAIIFSIVVFLGADIIAGVLLPGNLTAGGIIAILSLTILSNSFSSIIAPMSDYIGALKSRNILMTIFTILQAAGIFIASNHFGSIGTVFTYVIILLLMNSGYIVIALRAFFPKQRYELRQEIVYFILIVTIALICAIILRNTLFFNTLFLKGATFMSILIFLIFLLASILANVQMRTFFITKSFLDFQQPLN